MDRTGASDLAGLQNAKKINGKYCYFANIVFLCCKLPECFKSKGINHAFGVLMAGSQILFIAHIFSKQSKYYYKIYYKILLQNTTDFFKI